MAGILRIIERFVISGRGPVYIVDSHNLDVRIHEKLYDLWGNRFTVDGIEMSNSVRKLGDPFGILVKPMDGVQAEGNILVKEPLAINFLFCNHPLYPRKVDEDYEDEYITAGKKHLCALLSYEDLTEGKLTLYGEDIEGLTIYRGWMLKPETYRFLYQKLEEKGIILINTPEEYERYHLLPGWYDDFKEDTAESVWTEGNDIRDVLEISKELDGSAIIKDYVKSRKHEWYDACFIENVHNEERLKSVAGNFIERQGFDLVGGVVLRKFEKLKQTGYHEKSGMPLSEEYRVFIYAGRILAIDDYWMEGSDVRLSDDEYEWVKSIASKIRSSFVTVDLARREDGRLMIMEFGDGQVSGLQQIAPEKFYPKLDGKISSIKVWYEDLTIADNSNNIQIWEENGELHYSWYYAFSSSKVANEISEISLEKFDQKIDELGSDLEFKPGSFGELDYVFFKLQFRDRFGNELKYEWSSDDIEPKELREFWNFMIYEVLGDSPFRRWPKK